MTTIALPLREPGPIMDSNLYTKILDEQNEKLLKDRKDKDLHAKFEKECEETPYLQQCKMYDD